MALRVPPSDVFHVGWGFDPGLVGGVGTERGEERELGCVDIKNTHPWEGGCFKMGRSKWRCEFVGRREKRG